MKLPPLLVLFILGIALLAFTSAPVHLSNSTAVDFPHNLYTQRQAFFFEQNVGQTDSECSIYRPRIAIRRVAGSFWDGFQVEARK